MNSFKKLSGSDRETKEGMDYFVLLLPRSYELDCLCLKKEPWELHFDPFAFILSGMHHIEQIDHEDIIGGKLSQFSVVIFPGGLIFDVEAALGNDGAEVVCKYVHNGGGFFGVCAGAFLAAAGGYNGAIETKRMLSVQTSWTPGIGSAKLEFTKDATAILGPQCSPGKVHETMFANGPLFQSSKNETNHILHEKLSECVVLAQYKEISTDKSKNSKQYREYKIAAVASQFGTGRLIVFGPHPRHQVQFSKNVFKDLFYGVLSSHKRMQLKLTHFVTK